MSKNISEVSSHPLCGCCNRKGDLICQTVQPPARNVFGEIEEGKWIFRYYLCRWHRAARNRFLPFDKRKKVIKHIEDSILLKQDKTNQIS